MNHELRTTNYKLNTSDERQATCDEFALFWSFYADFCAFCADFCAFCASLRLKRTVFTRLQLKICPKGLHNFAFYILIFDFPPCFCAFLRPKNPFNPWLINDLRSTKVYVRKNNLFMQNKANFQKVKLNVNEVLTKDYVQMDTWSIRTTKPIQSQLKPIQSQLKPIQSQLKPIQSQLKPIQSQSKPIKAKTNPIQTQSPAGSSEARKKSISCARQLVRKSTGSSIKSLPKITENNPGVEKTSHKEENKIKTRLLKECKNVF